ncbi:MAG: TRAP transporter small permease [Synergistaceae bacterium]|nr:TRAP transporter small permease [Synergistaceae bacterium]
MRRLFDHLERYLLAAFMAAITFVVFIQVVFRQLGASLPWSEELTRYLLVWITMIGASEGVKRAVHVGVEAFTLLLPLKLRKLVNIAALLICVAFCGVVLYYSLFIIRLQAVNRQITPAMQIPMWIAYAALPAGAFLMIVRYLQVVVRSVREFGSGRVPMGLED